jgi:hypothetical protein
LLSWRCGQQNDSPAENLTRAGLPELKLSLKVPPRRKPNSKTREREHLTEAEIERLMKAAGENRYGHRD